MNRILVNDNNNKPWERVSMKTARKVYEAGFAVCFIPVNMKPFGPWGLGAVLDKNEVRRLNCDADFEKVCDNLKYYNCNAEAGRYIAFYIPAGTVDA